MHIASVMITFSWTLQGSILVFLQVLSQKSVPDDILAVVKFYLPIQYGRVATEQHVNGKVTWPVSHIYVYTNYITLH